MQMIALLSALPEKYSHLSSNLGRHVWSKILCPSAIAKTRYLAICNNVS